MATRPARTRYPLLDQIKDPVLQQKHKLHDDQIADLQTKAEAIGTLTEPLAQPLHAGGFKLQHLADPAQATDAVTLQYLKKYVEGALATALASGTVASGPATPAPNPPGVIPSNLPCVTNVATGQPAGVPAAPNLRWWRGDFCGISVPGLPAVPQGSADASLVFTPFLDRYSPADQVNIFTAYKARGYTHFSLSWPDSRDRGGTAGTGQTIAQYVATSQLVQAQGLYPHHMLRSKDYDPPDIPTIMTGLVPLLAALQAANTIPIAGFWELSIGLTPTQVQSLIDQVAAIVVPGTNLYVHFQPDYISFQQPGTFGSTFWLANVGKLTGVLHQKDLAMDCGLYQARVNDGLVRFNGGPGGFGYPADSGFGHPFDYVAWETSAGLRFNASLDETGAQLIGRQAISTSGPIAVQGYGNGGPIV